MTSSAILVWLLFCQIILFALLASALLLHRGWLHLTQHISTRRTLRLSTLFFSCIKDNQPLILTRYARALSWKNQVLIVLEQMSRRFQGEPWDALQRAVTDYALLPTARRWSHSCFWRRRHFAARAFALFPLAEDEAHLLHLMTDRHFLVRSRSALAAVRLGSEQGLQALLHEMKQAQGYLHYIYRDLLLQMPLPLFQKLLAHNPDPAMRPIYLDLLSAKTWGVPIPSLQDDLHDPDPTLRQLALRVFTKNPFPHCGELFAAALHDPIPAIRVEATQGLINSPSRDHLSHLAAALHDEAWWVRVGAARALHRIHPEGEALLHQERDPKALEAIHYVEKMGP